MTEIDQIEQELFSPVNAWLNNKQLLKYHRLLQIARKSEKATTQNYTAMYQHALNIEHNKLTYIDLMQPAELREEMKTLISMLDAERRQVKALQEKLKEPA